MQSIEDQLSDAEQKCGPSLVAESYAALRELTGHQAPKLPGSIEQRLNALNAALERKAEAGRTSPDNSQRSAPSPVAGNGGRPRRTLSVLSAGGLSPGETAINEEVQRHAKARSKSRQLAARQ